jgi:hypothetical protein
LGNVYRLVTARGATSDASTANASLIFQMFRDTFKTLELGESAA